MSSVLYCCCSSASIFTKKRTPSEGNFNNYAKLPVTPKKQKLCLKGMAPTPGNGVH